MANEKRKIQENTEVNGFTVEERETELPSNSIMHKRTPEFINKEDSLGRAFTVNLAEIEVDNEKAKSLQKAALLIGFRPKVGYNSRTKTRVAEGGVAIVPDKTGINNTKETKEKLKEILGVDPFKKGE